MTKRKVLRLINQIESMAEHQSWFDGTFVLSVKEQLGQYGTISELQLRALHNIKRALMRPQRKRTGYG